MSLRVGVDGTPLIGALTGVGNYTYDLIAGLAALPEAPRISVLPISWRLSAAAQVPPAENVRLVRALAPARPLRRLWNSVAFPPVEAFVRGDVFHATNFIAPRTWRTPTVVTVHDLWFVTHPAEVEPAQAGVAALLPGVLRRAAAVITVSEFVRQELLDWQPSLGAKVRAIPIAPHPRSVDGPEPVDIGGAPFALMLGSVNRRKNLPLALDALLAARADGVTLRLVIAGGVDPTVELAAELARRGLHADDVLVLGYVSDGAIVWLLEHAQLLLSSSSHEGFGLPLIEAMQAGLPVVAADGGAVAEVCRGAASLAELDAEDLGRAIVRVVSDAEYAAGLVERGRVVAAEYSWDRTAAQTFDMYRALK